jgi:hypothetical protein
MFRRVLIVSICVGAVAYSVGGLWGPWGRFSAFLGATTFVALVAFAAVRVAAPSRWLIDPAVLATIGSILVPYVFAALLLYGPDGAGMWKLARYMDSYDTAHSLERAAMFVFLGTVGLWLGYWSTLPQIIGSALDHVISRYQLRATRPEPSISILWALALCGVAARFVQNRLGVFGFSSDIEALKTYATWTNVLATAAGATQLALLLSAFHHFRSPGNQRMRTAFYVLFVVQVAFGFLSGFKGQVVMPFVVAGICWYAARGRVPMRLIVAASVATFVAYLVIEPYRALSTVDADFRQASLTQIAANLGRAHSVAANVSADFTDEETPGFAMILVRRNDLIGEAALAIRYRDIHAMLPPDAPPFLKNLLLGPFAGFIPRFVWPTKPLQNIGSWYANTVLEVDTETHSESMSPVGYLYFAGGALAVFLGFAGIGVMQRITAISFGSSHGDGPSLMVFLGLSASLATLDSAVFTLYTGFPRMLVVLLVVQRVVYAGSQNGRNHAPA